MAVQLMVRLGLRRGEALGLTWLDVDLETGRVTIARQLQRIPDPKDQSRMVLARVPLKTAPGRDASCERPGRSSTGSGLSNDTKELHPPTSS
jgi:integrase